jgi:hypothetical protein
LKFAKYGHSSQFLLDKSDCGEPTALAADSIDQAVFSGAEMGSPTCNQLRSEQLAITNQTLRERDLTFGYCGNPAAQREEFFADVRQGSIGLSALYASLLTGLANAVEMSHFFDFARCLRTDYHIPMTTAVTSDVPGFSWAIVAAMAQSGVKYFATAPNSGERIGYTLQT